MQNDQNTVTLSLYPMHNNFAILFMNFKPKVPNTVSTLSPNTEILV